MDKTATFVVRLVTTVDTVTQNKDYQPLTQNHIERHMTLIQIRNMNKTIQIIPKVKSSCHKESNLDGNNVMFDEIANVSKCNVRILYNLSFS